MSIWRGGTGIESCRKKVKVNKMCLYIYPCPCVGCQAERPLLRHVWRVAGVPLAPDVILEPFGRGGAAIGDVALVENHVVDVVLVPLLDQGLEPHHVVLPLEGGSLLKSRLYFCARHFLSKKGKCSPFLKLTPTL